MTQPPTHIAPTPSREDTEEDVIASMVQAMQIIGDGDLNSSTTRYDLQVRISRALRLAAEQIGERSWRCFCCDEVFTDEHEARLHFGDLTLHSNPISDPACCVSLEQFRDMEHQLVRYRMEDSDKDREITGLKAEHLTALRQEEERGYETGLRDAEQIGEREKIVAWLPTALAKAMQDAWDDICSDANAHPSDIKHPKKRDQAYLEYSPGEWTRLASELLISRLPRGDHSDAKPVSGEYNPEMVAAILAADTAPPAASFTDAESMMAWLDEPNAKPVSQWRPTGGAR